MRQIYEGKESALNELDKEMEARGLEFVRYADDCIIMVGSEMAAKAKELTSRSWGVGNRYKIEKLNQLIRGWINYYKIGSMKSFCTKTDKHIRYRLRMCIWKHCSDLSHHRAYHSVHGGSINLTCNIPCGVIVRHRD